MPVGIIEQLKAVNIKKYHRTRDIPLLVFFKLRYDHLIVRDTVIKLGKRIAVVDILKLDLLVQTVQLGDKHRMHIIKIRICIQENRIFQDRISNELFTEMDRAEHILAVHAVLVHVFFQNPLIRYLDRTASARSVTDGHILPLVCFGWKNRIDVGIDQPLVDHDVHLIAF